MGTRGGAVVGPNLAHAREFPAEFLHSCNPPGFAPHQLRLKVGIPIILLRNISPAQGLANGTRLVVTHLSRSIIQARILTGSHVGNVVCLPRVNMDTDPEDKRVPIQIRRRQFPVRHAFAMRARPSRKSPSTCPLLSSPTANSTSLSPGLGTPTTSPLWSLTLLSMASRLLFLRPM